MILPEYKALFIHIPKAAGQSIENFLLESLKKDRRVDGSKYLLRLNDNPKKGPKRLAHLTASEYCKHKHLTQKQFKEYFKFTIVRDPLSRVFSFYRYRGFSSLLDFDVFVNQYLPKYFEEEYWFFRPQTDFIYDENEKLLVDYIGKLETIDSDFSIIAKKLGIDFNVLPCDNTSIEKGFISRKSLHLFKKHPRLLLQTLFKPAKKPTDNLSIRPKSIQLIHKLYERDFDLLPY